MLALYNALTRKKENFEPLDPGNVRMYVCGPTVYARPHIGNARSVVVYDVLYRLLRHLYGAEHVTYVRNITDVDDKINAAAIERGISIRQLTEEVTGWFHDDMDALNCLRPTVEPRATEYIGKMIDMTRRLIANGNAYVSQGHVLFDTLSPPLSLKGEGDSPPPSGRGAGRGWHYGMLSGRTVEEQQAGARIAVESYKKNPGDFVLWKPADAEDDESSKFPSPWGVGRPGWHIECSAMSTDLLGETFDIHGGGADLKFPHHENEIAQSCCANPGSEFAKVWVHNGFLTVNGEKMSKSLGNFITVRDLLDGNPLPLWEGAGGGVDFTVSPPTQPSPARGEGYHGEVIRWALLSTHYSKPLNWTDKLVEDAENDLFSFANVLYGNDSVVFSDDEYLRHTHIKEFVDQFFRALQDDMNISAARTNLYVTRDTVHVFPGRQEAYSSALKKMLSALGIATESYYQWKQEQFKLFGDWISGGVGEPIGIHEKITARAASKAAKNWAEADRIRDELKARGIILEDRPDGTTDWRRT